MRVSGKILPFVVDDEWEVKKNEILDVFSRMDHQDIIDKKKELSEKEEEIRRDCKALIQKWSDDRHLREESKTRSKKREREEDVEEEEDMHNSKKEEEVGLELPMYNKANKKVGVMLVCPCYYDFFKNYRFCVNNGYAACYDKDIGGHIHLFIARQLMRLEIPHGHVVDHINAKKLRNSFDNRCSNLRVVTRPQNAQNRPKRVKADSDLPQSKFNNVSYHTQLNKWTASFRYDGRHISLGCYSTDVEAAEAFDCYVWHNREKMGLNHQLNFDDKDYSKMTPYTPGRRKDGSIYKGVHKDGNKFRATVYVNGKRKHLGHFEMDIDAARAYDRCIVEHNIAYKILNFPNEHPNYDPRRIKTEKEDFPDGIHCYLRSKRKGVNAANFQISISDYDRVKYHALSVSQGLPRIRINGKSVLLYRYILNVTDPIIYVEHYPDSNVFNCSRDNLVKGSALTNGSYKQPLEGKQFTGVFKRKNSFGVSVVFNRKTLFRKNFKSEEDAARARDLFILSRPDLPPKWMNFDDWIEPGVKTQWLEKMATLGVVFDTKE